MNRNNSNLSANERSANGTQAVARPVPAAQVGLPPAVHHHYYYEPKHKRRERSSKPGIAGALLIITAIFGLISGAFILGAGFYIGDFDNDFDFWGMKDYGDVSGRITYMNGTGVDDVTVSIVGENLKVVTDDDGYYSIYDVPIGETEIMVEKDGYNTYIRKVIVSPESSDLDKDDMDWNSENEYNFVITSGSAVVERGEYPDWNVISGFMYACSTLIIIFSIIVLVGGIYAIKRQKYRMAVIGAVLGIFTVVGMLFSLIALFVLVVSRDEFDRGEQ